MARRPDDSPELTHIEEQLAESQAQIEALQTATADAEARAQTARAELAEARKQVAALEEQLAGAASERESVAGELSQVRSELAAAQATLREAASRYRAARLASAPEVPEDLVPEADDIAEIDRGFEAAQRLVGRVRERMEEEKLDEARAYRVPAGSPLRRPPDVSTLSPEDKIKLGLQQASEREGR